MTLTPHQRDRYSRSLKLRDFDEKNMDALLETRVAMVGAGGIGSPTLRLLTCLGFGTIRIIDPDNVELSNIQRQNVYNTEDIGKPKAETAAANLSKMNPDVHFEASAESIDNDNAQRLLKACDVIVDGLDSFQSRRAVNKASIALGIPYVFAGAIEYYANLSTFIPDKTGCLSCMIGDAQDNPENTAAVRGVSPALLSIVAGVEVREAVHLAIGKDPNLAGRLMTIDLDGLNFDFFDLERMDNCPECGN